MARQQNDHCLLTFAYQNWRIIKMQGLARVYCESLSNPHKKTRLDLTAVDWDSYTKAAEQMMSERDAITLEPIRP